MGFVSFIFNGVVTFYPASGVREQTSGAFTYTGSLGYAWHCALTGANVYRLGFSSTTVYPTSSNARAYGFSVRCVQNLHLFKLT